MKKGMIVSLLVALVLSVVLPFGAGSASAKAEAKFTVKLSKCIDGDTATFSKTGKTRFLYIDTPESTNKVESYGKEAANYTCDTLKKAKKIELQYDGPKKDKYDRTLAWVWVDGKLLQTELIKKGYVKQFYDYGTYSYESDLIKEQEKAQKNKVGYWSKHKPAAKEEKFTKKTYKTTAKVTVYPNASAKGKAVTTIPKGATITSDTRLNGWYKVTHNKKTGWVSGKQLQEVKPPAVKPKPKPEVFKNCTELRKKYPDGVAKGHPAYDSKHDRDKDGYACER